MAGWRALAEPALAGAGGRPGVLNKECLGGSAALKTPTDLEDSLDPTRIEEIRNASFPSARRGYDKAAVDAFLESVAAWLEDEAPGEAEDSSAVKGALTRVGEQTAAILIAAEEAAERLRRDAAERVAQEREAAEEEAQRVRSEASGKAEALIAEAEAKAEQIVHESIARHRRSEEGIASLVERRAQIAAETQQLAEDLEKAVSDLSEITIGDEPNVPGRGRADLPVEARDPGTEPTWEGRGPETADLFEADNDAADNETTVAMPGDEPTGLPPADGDTRGHGDALLDPEDEESAGFRRRD